MPYIISSGVTSDGFILESDTLELLDGGVMNQVTVFNLGYLNVSSGGAVNSATLNQDGWLTVSNGGTADLTTVNSGGRLYVSSGGTADNTTVSSGGYFFIYENGTTNSTTVNSGTIVVYRGGMANSTTVNSGGGFYVSSGGTADLTTVNSGGRLYVSNGGTANSTTVDSGGRMDVYDSGTATYTAIDSGGRMDVKNRGAANSATVGVEGTLNVSSGGTAGGILVQEGGRLTVLSGGKIASATVQSGGKLTGDFDFSVISFDSSAVLDFGVFCRQAEDQGAIIKNISSVPDGVCYSITVAENQKEGTYLLADGITSFDHTVSLCNPEIQIGTLTLDETVKINGNDYTLRLNDGELTLTVEESEKTVTQYVYLDFDGEVGMRYRNSDLKLFLALTVRDSGISEERRQTILSELTEQYAEDGIVFTLERPEDTDYSTLYFGKSKAFDEYGEFFGVSETHDRNNQDKNDRAFVLLDQSYSDGQIVSVASHMLDHLLGYSYMADGTPELRQYAESKYLLSTEWNQTDPYNKYVPAKSKKSHYYTGCTNTAAAQIINYWIEKGLLDFSLSLNESDAYEKNDISISADDNPASGHLSFAETNKLLADYEPGDEDSIAALCFAVGVVQQAEYKQDGTSTSWSTNLFQRSGFEKAVSKDSYYSDEIYWPENAEGYQDENTRLPDTEYIIQELLQGRPVGLSLKWDNGKESGGRHAVVLDGYDSSSNTFHLNYGWGGDSNEWYTLKRMMNRGVDQTITGIVPVTSPDLEVKDLTFDMAFIDRSEDATLRFSIANTGKEKSTPTVAAVYCGTTFLTSLELDYVSPGSSRDCSCSFDASDLAAGENTITVKVCSQKEEGDVSSTTGTVRVYDGAITDTDDTWNLAAAGGSRTRVVAEYDTEGNMPETVLAEGEYIGGRDLVDFREVTLGHAGTYTFTLSGFTNDLELAIYSLTAKNNLKLVKSLTAFSPDDTAVLSEVPLERGTYYISVRAVNEETPGDSDYRLVFSGAGNHKADNSDDWADLESSGIDGAVGSVGVIDEETGEIITGGWVGLGDEFDYRLFELPCAAKMSFTITASDAVKFTVYEIREKTGKNGVTTYSLKSLQSLKVKAGVPAATKGLLLSAGNTPGKYCFSVQSTNASKGGSADYAVTFNPADSIFYSKGDSSDDWGNLKTNGAEGAVGEACMIADGDGEILSGWVGFGDAVDYKTFTLGSGAKLSFTLNSTDAAKFTVWKLNEKTDKKGVTTYSLKSLQSTKLTKNKMTGAYAATTKTLLLDEGTYYFSVESTNAAKGGNADYTVALNAGSSVFYVDADTGENNWLYAKKVGLNWTLHDSDAVVVHSGTTRIRFDRDTPDIDGTDDFVGCGDEADYLKIRLEKDAVLSFTAKAADASKFVIYSLSESTDKKGNAKYSVKTLQTTKLSKPKGATEYAATTKALSLAAGDYYISMQSTNAKKGGCAYYTVSLNQDACAGLPEEFEIQEVSGALAPTELCDLNAARYPVDELADACAFGGFASQYFIGDSCTGLLAGL